MQREAARKLTELEREVEAAIRETLNAEMPCHLQPGQINLPGGSTMQVDGIDHDAKVAVEIITRLGPRTGVLDDKVAADALRLVFVSKALGGGFKCGIAGDVEFLGSYDPQSSSKWLAHALEAIGVHIWPVVIDSGLRTRLDAAVKAKQAEEKGLGTLGH